MKTTDLRYWSMDITEPIDPGYASFGQLTTYGIVDDSQGRIILYCHETNVSGILHALQTTPVSL